MGTVSGRRLNTLQPNTEISPPLPGVAGKTVSNEIFPLGSTFSIEHENHLGGQAPNTSSETKPVTSSTLPPITISSPPTLTGTLVPQVVLASGKIINAGTYDPEIPTMLVDFFTSKNKTRTITETLTWKNGEVREVEKIIPNAPPSFNDFARLVGVTSAKLKKWAKKYPEMAEAYDVAEDIYEDFLVENGLLGNYPGQFATFVAKNKTKLRDDATVKHLSFNVTDFLNKLESGEVSKDDL